MIKKPLTFAACSLAFAATCLAQTPTKPVTAPAVKTTEKAAPKLTADQIKARTSYGVGYQSAFQLANAGLQESDFDKAEFFNGFKQALKGADLKYTPEQLDAAMQALQEVLMARDKKIGVENLAKGEAFLAENAKKPGVKTTKSGLQYLVLEKGSDKKYVAPESPKGAPAGVDAQSEFLVNYRGTLIDGTEFDKSPDGKPVAFTLQVVPGFAEALKMMPIGSKWKIFLPSKLGYGPQRQGAKLAPNSALIFEVELKEIRKRKAPQQLPFQLPPGMVPGQ